MSACNDGGGESGAVIQEVDPASLEGANSPLDEQNTGGDARGGERIEATGQAPSAGQPNRNSPDTAGGADNDPASTAEPKATGAAKAGLFSDRPDEAPSFEAMAAQAAAEREADEMGRSGSASDKPAEEPQAKSKSLESDRLQNEKRQSALMKKFRDPTGKQNQNAKVNPFGGKGLAPNLLELRLKALAKRVAEMHRVWERTRAQDARSRMQIARRKLRAKLNPIIKDIERMASVSVHVRDLASQLPVFDHEGDALRNPASNQKMLTASAALDLMGPEFRFKTKVFRWQDSLYIVGGGDPVLMPRQLEELAQKLAKEYMPKDVKRVVVDDTAFTEERFIPGIELDNVGVAYAAPTGALSMNYNAVSVTVKPTKPGLAASVDVRPENPHVRLENNCVTGDDVQEKATAFVRTVKDDEGTTVVKVTGVIPPEHTGLVQRRRIYDPAEFAGLQFSEALAEAVGRSTPLPVVRAPTPEQAHLLKTHKSRPLFDIVKVAMAYSNNFVVEQVARTMSWKLTGDPASFEDASEVLGRYWETIGVTPRALVVENGSGLTRQGRFTAKAIVDLVSAADLIQTPNSGLIAVLPVAGKPGTLRNRVLKARGRLRAKTGTLNGVSALSGVLTTNAGTPALALSIMINPGDDSSMGVGGRHRAEERIVNTLMSYVDDANQNRWRRRARR